MTPSPACFALIRRFEGFRAAAYKDAVGIWTIGYGTTAYPDESKVKPGDRCTQEQAESFLVAHVEDLWWEIEELVSPPLQQCRCDALCSLIYNIGIGAFGRSTMLRKLNQGDMAGAAAQFDVWVKGRKVTLPGLVKRRAAERALFEQADATA